MTLDNGRAAVELSFKISLGLTAPSGEAFVLAGHLDRLVEFGGAKWIIDYKTTKTTLSEHYFAQFSPNNQITLYTAAGQVAFNTPTKGVLIDGIQVLVGAARFARAPAYRHESVVEEWMNELPYWLGRANAYATAGVWPMNDKACGNYGGCPFQRVCQMAPKMRLSFLTTNYAHKVWNPLENR